MTGLTPSQTVGPFYSLKLEGGNVVASSDAPGEWIRIEGRVFDGEGAVVDDALIESWQADREGTYADPGVSQVDEAGFTGFGRAATDFATGDFWLETIKPGRVPDPEGELQAPHISLIVQARGMLKPVFTRLYFPEETEANRSDWVMQAVPADRRHTLIANLASSGPPALYRFDIRLQGDDETVFLTY